MYKIQNQTFTKIPSEEEEQKALIKWLKKNNYFFFANVNENKQSFTNKFLATKIEAKSKSMGKVKGVSDLCVFTENTIVFIELKKQRPVLKNGSLGVAVSKPTEEQMQFIAKVNGFKYAYGFIAFGCDECIKILTGTNLKI
jgi:hypothetical protein